MGDRLISTTFIYEMFGLRTPGSKGVGVWGLVHDTHVQFPCRPAKRADSLRVGSPG